MTVGLLPACRLGSAPGGGAVRARLGLRVSECHIVGSHMPRLQILLSHTFVLLCLRNFRCQHYLIE